MEIWFSTMKKKKILHPNIIETLMHACMNHSDNEKKKNISITAHNVIETLLHACMIMVVIKFVSEKVNVILILLLVFDCKKDLL